MVSDALRNVNAVLQSPKLSIQPFVKISVLKKKIADGSRLLGHPVCGCPHEDMTVFSLVRCLVHAWKSVAVILKKLENISFGHWR